MRPVPTPKNEGFNFNALSKSFAIDGSASSPGTKGDPDFSKGKSNSETLSAIRASLKNDFKKLKDVSDHSLFGRT